MKTVAQADLSEAESSLARRPLIGRAIWKVSEFPPARKMLGAIHRLLWNRVNLLKAGAKSVRRLEIGPGRSRIPSFETANIIWSPVTDYVCNSSRRVPVAAATFDTVYASHILEHIPWYETQKALLEWKRILKPGGALEVWVPDGLKICRAFILAEDDLGNDFQQDGWYKFNDSKNPALWFNGRIFSYGDGKGTLGHPNWHVALLTERLLREHLEAVGFINVTRLTNDQVRGYDHGWINLGMRAEMPRA